MTTLDLKPECVDQPMRLDLAVVEAMMLWPDDPAARERLVSAAMLHEGKSRIGDMPEPLLRRYTVEALDAPRLHELNAGKRHVHGSIAGRIVLEATVYANHAPEMAALGKVKERLAEGLKGTFQIEPRTMNNKTGPLYRFRPVAHLWAAFSLANIHGDKAWPCRIAHLPTFLAAAEAIRKLAETSRAPKAKATIMRPGEAVILPAAIVARLPKVELRIAA